MWSEEYQAIVWKAGDIVPEGRYVRLDDPLHRLVVLEQAGPLPATCDGHVAFYRALPGPISLIAQQTSIASVTGIIDPVVQ